jgi:hypothetical protein
MSIHAKYLAVFEEDCTYHIYNRTNNKELLFRSDDNCELFLRQYCNYLNSFIDVYCYCLLPNHFHFMIRVKSATPTKEHLQSLHRKYIADKKVTPLIESAFRRFITFDSMAFNRRFNCTSNLFQRQFKWVVVDRNTSIQLDPFPASPIPSLALPGPTLLQPFWAEAAITWPVPILPRTAASILRCLSDRPGSEVRKPRPGTKKSEENMNRFQTFGRRIFIIDILRLKNIGQGKGW